ncbi:MAG: PKD domain-containing protein, partial [Rhizobacter sp.]|nr:PKD domain-containing protein [Ferruginibacter sp.]
MITSFATRAYCLLLFTLLSFAGKSQLTANFSANPATGCAPLLVNFTDQSTGNPTQWKWDLGNGTISFLQNPSVSYFNPGFYSIKLVVKNAANADSVVKTQFISVSAKPTAQFTAATTTGCFPLPVQFTDQSTGGNDSITTWQWDFGDGYSSGLENPLHVYNSSGNYNVTLRVINSKGCLNTISKTQYIQINAGVKAGFSNSVPTVCNPPVSINFQNLSTGTGVLTYKWSFGDSTGSALANPAHIYNTPGTYSIQLIVTNATGCTDTITKANAFTVGNVFPAFTSNDTVCIQTPLVITNSSNPLPSSATWDFGDGTSSTQISPVKLYTVPGTYQIKLLANFGSCLDSASKTVKVLAAPTAAFIADDSANCSYPFTVNFTSKSLNASSYLWDFGDNTTSTSPNPAHTYNSYGNFDVQLTVTSANGCTDIIKKTNHIKIIKPVVAFNNLPDSGCVPFTKYFTASTTSIDPV